MLDFLSAIDAQQPKDANIQWVVRAIGRRTCDVFHMKSEIVDDFFLVGANFGVSSTSSQASALICYPHPTHDDEPSMSHPVTKRCYAAENAHPEDDNHPTEHMYPFASFTIRIHPHTIVKSADRQSLLPPTSPVCRRYIASQACRSRTVPPVR